MGQPRNRGSNYLQSLGLNDPDRKTPAHDWILLEWLTKERLLELGMQLFPVSPWEQKTLDSLRQRANDIIAKGLTGFKRDLREAHARIDAELKKSPDKELPGHLWKAVRGLESEIERLQSWQGLSEPPSPSLKITKIDDAFPIYDGERSRRPAVYIDRFVSFERRHELGVEGGLREQILERGLHFELPTWWLSLARHVIAIEVKSRIPSYSELIQQLTTYRGFLRDSKIVVVSPDDKFKSAVEEQGFAFIKCPEPPKSPKVQTQLFD